MIVVRLLKPLVVRNLEFVRYKDELRGSLSDVIGNVYLLSGGGTTPERYVLKESDCSLYGREIIIYLGYSIENSLINVDI